MIRPAIPHDIFRLADMGQAFFAEAGFSAKFAGLSFDLDSFAHTVAALIEHGVLLVAEKEDSVVGMAGAGIAPAWWNRNVLTCQELFWYIEKPHRFGLGTKLMQALEAAVADLGVVLFSMSAEEGLRSEALNRIYRQRGYFPTERLFWKQLTGAQRCLAASSAA